MTRSGLYRSTDYDKLKSVAHKATSSINGYKFWIKQIQRESNQALNNKTVHLIPHCPEN